MRIPGRAPPGPRERQYDAVPSAPRTLTWRTPAVVVACGCLIALISFGPRSALGQFLTPMSLDFHWGREVFSFALAVQNLLWGVFQPFSGAVADRFGTVRVLWAGSIAYAAGLIIMSYATSPGLLDLSAGVLIGFGLSGCSFNLVIGALGKLVPEDWRSLRSAPAPRPDRSASSCSRRWPAC